MSPAEAATNEAESRISYEELRVVRDDFAAALDAANPGGDGMGRVAHYFTAKTFARFARDAHGRINGRTFMEFVVRHAGAHAVDRSSGATTRTRTGGSRRTIWKLSSEDR